ncbi:hypothetical protein C8J57DRAFT_1717693 [Mycena rebaudengoi]|nr:hypothetical protein C8J57DRAFT_1717693 [Mycena rebaudengoi]
MGRETGPIHNATSPFAAPGDLHTGRGVLEGDIHTVRIWIENAPFWSARRWVGRIRAINQYSSRRNSSLEFVHASMIRPQGRSCNAPPRVGDPRRAKELHDADPATGRDEDPRPRAKARSTGLGTGSGSKLAVLELRRVNDHDSPKTSSLLKRAWGALRELSKLLDADPGSTGLGTRPLAQIARPALRGCGATRREYGSDPGRCGGTARARCGCQCTENGDPGGAPSS